MNLAALGTPVANQPRFAASAPKKTAPVAF